MQCNLNKKYLKFTNNNSVESSDIIIELQMITQYSIESVEESIEKYQELAKYFEQQNKEVILSKK